MQWWDTEYYSVVYVSIPGSSTQDLRGVDSHVPAAKRFVVIKADLESVNITDMRACWDI